MIYVDQARCTGCAACMGVCPTGAIAIEDGGAVIAETLCDKCGDCLKACPQRAIILVDTVSPGALVPTTKRATEIAKPHPRQIEKNLRQQLMPAAQTALLWAGRELLPRLADLALNWIDRSTAGQTSRRSGGAESSRTAHGRVEKNRAESRVRRRARRRQGRAYR